MGTTERRARERKKRREEILNAAEKVFARKGITSTTIDDIATEAELGKGTLYNYFPSKEAILWHCAVRGMQKLRLLIEKKISAGEEAAKNLMQMARAFIAFSSAERDYFNIFLHAGMGFSIPAGITESEVKEVFEKESPYGLIRNELTEGQRAGIFRADIDAGVLSHAVWLQFYGFMQILSLNSEMVEAFRLNHNELIEVNMQTIINGIRDEKSCH